MSSLPEPPRELIFAKSLLPTLHKQLDSCTKDNKYCLPLLHEDPKHHGYKGDPGVTPGSCGAVGEKVQVILM